MALDLAALEEGLESVASNPPATHAACAKAWAEALGEYAEGIVPASTTVEVAVEILEEQLVAAFQTTNAAPRMEIAMGLFAFALATGMAGFEPALPPVAVGFSDQFSTKPETHAQAAEEVANLIDTWMRTGTATPTGGGTPVNWS